MKITQLQFYLLIWCRAAETLTDQLIDLGQNVTINCSLDVEIYWLLIKLPHPPAMILRFFPAVPFYYNEKFRQKYSLQSKYDLFINNVTLDELGVYYCMSVEITERTFSNGIRLHIIEPTPESQNNTMAKCIEQNLTQWTIITIISGLMNGVLIIVVIGLLKVFAHGSKKTSESSVNFGDNLQQPQDMNLEQDSNQAQANVTKFYSRQRGKSVPIPEGIDDSDSSASDNEYAEVNLPAPLNKLQSIHVSSTYALVQMPKS